MKIFVLIFLYCATSVAAATELKHSNFLNVSSCFSGPFASFDSWRAFLVDRKPGFSESMVRPHAKHEEAAQRKLYEYYRSNIVCENFDYLVDNVLVRGFYIAPARNTTNDRASGARSKLPLIIFNRGGNGDLGASTFGYIMSNFFPLAEQGFVIVGSQYRGFIKKIPNPTFFTNSPSLGEDEFGGKDLNDVLKLIELAKFFPHTDSNKIGMYGFSRGGMMTYMAAKQSHAISAIAVAGGVVDLARELSFRPEMEQVYKARIPNYTAQKEQALTERSAIKWAEKIPTNIPILLLHGGNDERVDVKNAKIMAQKLTELKHPHKLVIYEGDNHSISGHRREMQDELITWFNEKLRN